MEKQKRWIVVGLMVAAAAAMMFVIWPDGSDRKETPKSPADSGATTAPVSEPVATESAPQRSAKTPTKTAADPAPPTGVPRQQQISKIPATSEPRQSPLEPKESARVFGQRVTAQVQVDRQSHDLSPNQVGRFQRVHISPNAKVAVQIAYPEGEPNQNVVLEAKDGGQFENGAISKLAKLDAQRNLSFTFQADRTPGIYQVSLRKGADEKVLDFWVGPEREVAGQASN